MLGPFRGLMLISPSALCLSCPQVFLQILGVIAVAASAIPWILVPVAPLLVAFLFLRRYFLRTSRDIKRLESTSRFSVGTRPFGLADKRQSTGMLIDH